MSAIPQLGPITPLLTPEEIASGRAARRLERHRRQIKDTSKHDNRVMLKIKLASLAAEARIIRREEERRRFDGGPHRFKLWYHRTHDVRMEARATHLAYGVMRGLDIERMERNWDDPVLDHCGKPNAIVTFNHRLARKALCDRVIALLKKYGHSRLYGDIDSMELPKWLSDGRKPV